MIHFLRLAGTTAGGRDELTPTKNKNKNEGNKKVQLFFVGESPFLRVFPLLPHSYALACFVVRLK
jgi:hypothetical protein